MSLLHNLWTTASTNKHNASHTSALLWLCVQRDKEPLGVRMVSSPVSRDAGTQPDNQPARSQRFTHGIRTRSAHTPPFIVNLHLHRLGAVFEAIEPKLVQKSVNVLSNHYNSLLLPEHRDNTGCVLVNLLTGFETESFGQECETRTSK